MSERKTAQRGGGPNYAYILVISRKRGVNKQVREEFDADKDRLLSDTDSEKVRTSVYKISEEDVEKWKNLVEAYPEYIDYQFEPLGSGREISEDVGGNGLNILPINPEQYYEEPDIEYMPTDDEYEMYDGHRESGQPLLLIGPTGVGKTLSIANYGWINGFPVMQFDCAEDTKRYDLIGRFLLKGEEVVYELGALPKAIELANKEGTAILVLEELNALTPQMQKVLNQFLDWRRHAYVPEIGKTFRLDEDANLLIFATMNPSTYGGVHELNRDLRSRFGTWFWEYPEADTEQEIVEDVAEENGISQRDKEGLVRLAMETRKSEEQGDLEYSISTRDITQFIEIYGGYKEVFGDNKAFSRALETAILGKYENEDSREFVRERAERIFGSREERELESEEAVTR